jgi:hypothetical protein
MAFSVALLTGCSSTTYQTVRIETDPAGAQITINGGFVGTAPLSKSLLVDAFGVPMKDRFHVIEARSDCYFSERLRLESDSDMWSNPTPYPSTVTLRLRPDSLIGTIPQNVNFAITASSLRAFLDAAGVPYQTAPSQFPLEAADIAAKSRLFSVVVECWE